MYTFEIDYATHLKVKELLKTKEGVCEVMPKVRITNLEQGLGNRIDLVCVHPNSRINTGCSAKYCTNCQNKDEVYESNKAFGKVLSEIGKDFINIVNLENK